MILTRNYLQFRTRDVRCDQTGVVFEDEVMLACHDQGRCGYGLHVLRGHGRLDLHHASERIRVRLCKETFRKRRDQGTLDEDVGTACGYGTERARIHDLKLERNDASVAETEHSRLVKALSLYELIHIRSHILVMVFRKTRIRSLTARVEGIDHVAGLCKLALGGFEVIMASAVSMQENHRLAGTFSRMEETDTVHFDGIGIACIINILTGSCEEKRNKAHKDSRFHISFVSPKIAKLRVSSAVSP